MLSKCILRWLQPKVNQSFIENQFKNWIWKANQTPTKVFTNVVQCYFFTDTNKNQSANHIHDQNPKEKKNEVVRERMIVFVCQEQMISFHILWLLMFILPFSRYEHAYCTCGKELANGWILQQQDKKNKTLMPTWLHCEVICCICWSIRVILCSVSKLIHLMVHSRHTTTIFQG